MLISLLDESGGHTPHGVHHRGGLWPRIATREGSARDKGHQVALGAWPFCRLQRLWDLLLDVASHHYAAVVLCFGQLQFPYVFLCCFASLWVVF